MSVTMPRAGPRWAQDGLFPSEVGSGIPVQPNVVLAASQGHLRFRLECVPPRTNHQRKRIVRIGKFARLADKPELEEAKAFLVSLLEPHRPPAAISGPVRLTVEWTWPWLKSQPRRFTAGGPQWHTSKPDLTNVAKTLEDRLVALRFLEDDRSVAELVLRKMWGPRPGILVEIQRL